MDVTKILDASENEKLKAKVLKVMEKNLTDLCPGGASGGRVGFQGAGPVVAAGVECGKERMKRIMNGSKATKPEIGIIKKIMDGAGKFAKSVVNPAEWIRLRNWIGPEAMLFFGGFEAGIAKYDQLEKGTPWKEALSNTLFGFVMEKDPCLLYTSPSPRD